MTLGLSAVAAIVGCAVLAWIYRRPQRGLLMLAALIPFNGLLILVPEVPLIRGWKEALVLITLVMTYLRHRTSPEFHGPTWLWVILASLALSVVSALAVGGLQGIVGVKIGYFYLLIWAVMRRAPLGPKDRDHLITILMVTAQLAAAYGLLQQIIGPEALVSLGYRYNDEVRFTGGYLRSFSTFNQPFGFAFYMSLAILVAGSVALHEPRRLRNMVFLLSTPVLIVAMGLTFVRGAYVSLAVGIVVLALVRYRAMLLLVPLALALIPWVPATAWESILSSSSLGQRAEGWAEVTQVIANNPFGIGIGATGAAREKVESLTAGGNFYIPDSQLVKWWLELGVIGLWLNLLVVLMGFWGALNTARGSRGRDSALALGVAASILGALAACTVATYFEIFPMDVMFWYLLGVVIVISSESSWAKGSPATGGPNHAAAIGAGRPSA